MLDIARWLADQGLGRHVKAFEENGIEDDVLRELTDDDLKELGLNLGDRKRLRKAIAALGAAESRDVRAAHLDATPREAERRQLTVMFVDLVGSTELSQKLDPEELGEIMRRYHVCCSEGIARWGGHVAKFMGDGVLIYFGWPEAHEDDAERSVRAGLALVEVVGQLTTPSGASLAARVGIATGLVVVGELSSDGDVLEDVVGGTPNLAARLQAVAAPRTVVIGSGTRHLLGSLFELVELGPQKLKGFVEPQSAFRVVRELQAKGRFEALRGERFMPLVGRDAELAILLERWARAANGEGQVVLLLGEAGIGKSRLVRALRERLTDQTYTPLGHNCSPHHINSALHPVIELLERAAGFERNDPSATRLAKLEALLALGSGCLDQAVPLVAALLGVPLENRYTAPNLTSEQQKQRTLEVLVEQVGGLAARQPVLAIYEDVHWIDPTTLEVLGLLIARISDLPVLVLVTCRPEFQASWGSHAHVMQLSLTRLTRGHGSAMVENMTRGKALPAEVLDQILARTDGVPLFVEELTKTVLEAGLLRDHGDRFELTGALPAHAIPASLHDSLMARLDRFASVKEVAQIGAVIGRSFSHRLLATVSALPDSDLRAALDQLIAAELVFRRGEPPEAIYTFKHALVQDAAYQSLLRSRRQILHQRIAEGLAGDAYSRDQQPELIAHHLTEAHLVEQAIPCWRRAGRRATGRSANVEAVAHLRRALDLLAARPASEARDLEELEVRLELTVPLIAVHGFGSAEVEACAARARDLASASGAPTQQFMAARVVWNSSLMRQPLSTTLARAAELKTQAEGSGDKVEQALANRALGYTLSMVGRQPKALDVLRRGFALADKEPAARFAAFGEHPGVVCRHYAAWCCSLTGRLDEGLGLGEQAVDLARELDNPHMIAWALACLGYTVVLRRDGEAALRVSAEGLALSDAHRLPQWIGFNREIKGWGLFLCGNIEAAVGEMVASNQIIRATGATLHTSRSAAFLAHGHLELGDLAGARQWLGVARSYWEDSGEAYVGAEIERLDGLMIEAEDGPEVELVARLRRAVGIAREQGARLFELRALCELARFDHQASDALRSCLAAVEGPSELPDLAEGRSTLARLDGTHDRHE